MLKKISALTIGFLSLVSVKLSAQGDSLKKATTSFSGSVDAYYRFNFANAPGATNNLTSFTNSQSSFELGMASVKVEHSYGKVSAVADLGFGRRAQEFSYNDGGTSLAMVKQAYLSYAPNSSLKFTMGKWATHVGYELLDAAGNRNYSMSYGFSYGPFFHTGVKADISLGGKSALMVGFANPTDFVTTTSPVKVIIGQFSTATKNDKVKAFLNFQGATDLTQFDWVLTAAISNTFSVGYDGTVQTSTIGKVASSWSSNALYLNLDASSSFGLTLRGEYFSDRKLNPLITGSGNIFATTLSANCKVDKLTIIPELRLDNAKGNIFSKGSGAATNGTASFIIAAVYAF